LVRSLHFSFIDLWVWCMSFYKIVLFQTILWVVRPLFWTMWAHWSKSCSIFSIAFAFYISTFSVRKTIWKHTSHHDWWGDLSFSYPHLGIFLQNILIVISFV
jgi:hypothetical protein